MIGSVPLEEQIAAKYHEQAKQAYRQQAALLLLVGMLTRSEADDPVRPIVERAVRSAELLTDQVFE